MPVCFNSGLMKVVQKLCLIAITSYLYVTFSTMSPTCSLTNAGWKIYPFDKQFIPSSLLFMTTVAITIVESNVWPQNAKPRSVLLTFLVELYVMTTCIMVVYVVFWHPLVIITSVATEKLGAQANCWMLSTNVYKKSMPICMQGVRSTKLHCILLATVLLFGVLRKYGTRDLYCNPRQYPWIDDYDGPCTVFTRKTRPVPISALSRAEHRDESIAPLHKKSPCMFN